MVKLSKIIISIFVQVAPPLGWKFTPEEVTIDIDGTTDLCSQNKDINFVFAGFGVVGSVVSRGSSVGPAGVTINLLSGGADRQVVQTTVTKADGTYVFTAVPGSDHVVEAAHPAWTFEKAEGKVSMTGDNGQAEVLVVAGFDLRGKVVDKEKPMPGNF